MVQNDPKHQSSFTQSMAFDQLTKKSAEKKSGGSTPKTFYISMNLHLKDWIGLKFSGFFKKYNS